MVAGRLRLSVASSLVGIGVLWCAAFMAQQVCTTDARCTTEACPSRCSAPERILLVAIPVVMIATAIFLIIQRFSATTYVGLLAVLLLAAIILMILQVRSE